MSTLKNGDLVTIYKDLNNRHTIEGLAELLEILTTSKHSHIQQWRIHFLSDPPNKTYKRLLRDDSRTY